MVSLNEIVRQVDAHVWGWPLICFVLLVGIVLTVVTRFAQFRYFFSAWHYVFVPQKGEEGKEYITPFQAFLNMLNASIGNGSMAGMAVAVVMGGPGAGFWIILLGFLYMIIRFAEVYLSSTIHEEVEPGVIRGGPMIYLKKLPGGAVLAYVYAFFLLALGLITGNGMQGNSISLAVNRLTGIPPIYIAICLFVLVLYMMLGGARRIIWFSEIIVPVKVGLFFTATLGVLLYHYKAIIPALKLIVQSAVTPWAVAGGIVGFSIHQSLRYGMQLTVNATEAGLGTAGIFAGSIRSKTPVENSIMSMVSAFVSNTLVCFMLIVIMVASGVWNSGLVSTQLTSAAYESVFGVFGGAVVAFLSISFGLGVLVAYAYIGRESWRYLTHGRWSHAFTVMYSAVAFLGTLSTVDLIWNMTGIINAGLIIANLLGILYLTPLVKTGLAKWEKGQ